MKRIGIGIVAALLSTGGVAWAQSNKLSLFTKKEPLCGVTLSINEQRKEPVIANGMPGTEVAAWLNTLGVTGIVLKYRVPGNREGALQDLQRAVRRVRARHKDWNKP